MLNDKQIMLLAWGALFLTDILFLRFSSLVVDQAGQVFQACSLLLSFPGDLVLQKSARSGDQTGDPSISSPAEFRLDDDRIQSLYVLYS